MPNWASAPKVLNLDLGTQPQSYLQVHSTLRAKVLLIAQVNKLSSFGCLLDLNGEFMEEFLGQGEHVTCPDIPSGYKSLILITIKETSFFFALYFKLKRFFTRGNCGGQL